ncbi:MAG: DeoR/GlpR family DNA-binding transcription regulator [Verrucomicrobiota bacterium]|jgi:DeoR/GlpR family transcriptional regulator of sugar metabolism
MDTTRRRRIEQLLSERGECSVNLLARELGVSEMTIRRDLQTLAAAGRVVRSHGGAAAVEQVLFQFEFQGRSKINETAKRQIARVAAAMVRDGQSVMLDSGTTTLALALELLHRKRLTLITSSLAIASALQQSSSVQVLLLGGFVRRDSPDLVGIITENNIEHLKADWAFVGADGIDLQGNIYNASIEVCRMLTRMVARAKSAYVVADALKIGRPALMRFGNITDCQGLITDAGIQPKHLQALRKARINVLIANPEDAGSKNPASD